MIKIIDTSYASQRRMERLEAYQTARKNHRRQHHAAREARRATDQVLRLELQRKKQAEKTALTAAPLFPEI